MVNNSELTHSHMDERGWRLASNDHWTWLFVNKKRIMINGKWWFMHFMFAPHSIYWQTTNHYLVLVYCRHPTSDHRSWLPFPTNLNGNWYWFIDHHPENSIPKHAKKCVLYHRCLLSLIIDHNWWTVWVIIQMGHHCWWLLVINQLLRYRLFIKHDQRYEY